MPGQYTKSGSEWFLPHHSQFIIHDHLMVHSIITDTSLKDKGKDVPIHAIKLCVGGWGKGDVAFILLELNRGYGLDE